MLTAQQKLATVMNRNIVLTILSRQRNRMRTLQYLTSVESLPNY